MAVLGARGTAAKFERLKRNAASVSMLAGNLAGNFSDLAFLFSVRANTLDNSVVYREIS